MTKLLDCVLLHNNGNYYFFNGKNYARYSPGTGVDADYPRPISDAWPSDTPASGYKSLATVMNEQGWDSLDVALAKSDYKAYYFFHGREYVKYVPKKGVPDSYPRPLGWYDIWEAMPGPYDAAFYSPDKDKYYFFKGGNYVRVEPGDGIDSGYPRPIVEHWNGLGAYFPGPYSGACSKSGDATITYFFKGDEYVRYKAGVGVDNSVGDGEYAYPQSTSYRWRGVWALGQTSALTLGAVVSNAAGARSPTFSLRQLESKPINMQPINGVTLVELPEITNANFVGVTKRFRLDGVESGQRVNVVLESDGEVVESFTVKNAPTPGTNQPFTFGMSSCIYDSRQIQSVVPSVANMGAEEPDFLVWNGDSSYYVGTGSKTSGKDNVLAGDMKSQHNMFLRMYTTRHHPSVSAAVRSVPALSTWDDHDFGYNNATGGPGSNQMTPEQVQEATEVFRTCWPNDYFHAGITDPINYTFEHGGAAFFVPDSRTFRSPTNKVILGPEQCEALLADMRGGDMKDALLKVVVLTTQLISTKSTGEGFYATAGGDDPNGERMTLLEAFSDGSISGRVLVLSGDVHFSEISCYGGTAQNPSVVEITASPLLLRDPQGKKFPSPAANKYRVWSAKGNAYAMISVRYENGQPVVDLRLRDGTGTPAAIYRHGDGTGGNWERANACWLANGELTQLD